MIIINLELKNNNIIYCNDDKNKEKKIYSISDIKITIFLKDKNKGKKRLIQLAIIFIITVTLINIFVNQEFFSNYGFFIIFPTTFLFLYSYSKIFMKYFYEYTIIKLDKDKKIRLKYSGIKKDLADEIFKNAPDKKIVQSN